MQKSKNVLIVGVEPQSYASEDLRATKTTNWRRTTHRETDSQYLFFSVLRPFCRTTRYKGLSKTLNNNLRISHGTETRDTPVRVASPLLLLSAALGCPRASDRQLSARVHSASAP